MSFASSFTPFPILQVPGASIHFGDGAITATAVVVGDGEAAIVEVVVIIMAIIVGC